MKLLALLLLKTMPIYLHFQFSNSNNLCDKPWLTPHICNLTIYINVDVIDTTMPNVFLWEKQLMDYEYNAQVMTNEQAIYKMINEILDRNDAAECTIALYFDNIKLI